MIKKNDVKIGKIVAIGNNGEGIIKDEEKVIFVPFALLGEVVEYKALKVTSKCVFAKLQKVIEQSSDRVEAACPVFTKCGGCQLQHLSYDCQLKLKQENVKNTIKKIGFIDCVVDNTVCGENNFRYRNKLQLPVSQLNGQLQIGFYAENSHRVVPILDCVINAQWTKTLIECLTEYMLSNNLKGYDSLSYNGDIREITAREVSDCLIITLVCTKKNLPNLNKFVDLLKQKSNKEFSLYLNVNNNKNNVIYSDNFYLIYGKGEYFGNAFGIKFPMGVQSFMQVNTEVFLMLYSRVVDLVACDKNTVVIDAYSGAGLMTAMLAQKCKKAIGIEIIKEAVDLADQLAINNGLSHRITNYNGKCEELLPKVISKEVGDNQKVAVVLDPPRKGCEINVLQSIIDNNIDKVVYVSCNPATLARDLGVLTGNLIFNGEGIVKNPNPTKIYNVQSVTPFDMFPQTKHVESIVCLSRK